MKWGGYLSHDYSEEIWYNHAAEGLQHLGSRIMMLLFLSGVFAFLVNVNNFAVYKVDCIFFSLSFLSVLIWFFIQYMNSPVAYAALTNLRKVWCLFVL